MESIIKKILDFTKPVSICICCLDLQGNNRGKKWSQWNYYSLIQNHRYSVWKLSVCDVKTNVHTDNKYKHTLLPKLSDLSLQNNDSAADSVIIAMSMEGQLDLCNINCLSVNYLNQVDFLWLEKPYSLNHVSRPYLKLLSLHVNFTSGGRYKNHITCRSEKCCRTFLSNVFSKALSRA